MPLKSFFMRLRMSSSEDALVKLSEGDVCTLTAISATIPIPTLHTSQHYTHLNLLFYLLKTIYRMYRLIHSFGLIFNQIFII